MKEIVAHIYKDGMLDRDVHVNLVKGYMKVGATARQARKVATAFETPGYNPHKVRVHYGNPSKRF